MLGGTSIRCRMYFLFLPLQNLILFYIIYDSVFVTRGRTSTYVGGEKSSVWPDFILRKHLSLELGYLFINAFAYFLGSFYIVRFQERQ